jgi:hypothetical protein
MATVKCSTELGSTLTRKLYTWLKKLSTDKHSSLFVKSIRDEEENFELS